MYLERLALAGVAIALLATARPAEACDCGLAGVCGTGGVGDPFHCCDVKQDSCNATSNPCAPMFCNLEPDCCVLLNCAPDSGIQCASATDSCIFYLPNTHAVPDGTACDDHDAATASCPGPTAHACGAACTKDLDCIDAGLCGNGACCPVGTACGGAGRCVCNNGTGTNCDDTCVAGVCTTTSIADASCEVSTSDSGDAGEMDAPADSPSEAGEVRASTHPWTQSQTCLTRRWRGVRSTRAQVRMRRSTQPKRATRRPKRPTQARRWRMHGQVVMQPSRRGEACPQEKRAVVPAGLSEAFLPAIPSLLPQFSRCSLSPGGVVETTRSHETCRAIEGVVGSTLRRWGWRSGFAHEQRLTKRTRRTGGLSRRAANGAGLAAHGRQGTG
jgi:hypothetical protein